MAVLFVDAVQRMVKVMSEGETARDNRGVQDVRTETNYAARKFYSQRNMYLTGFTLFLSLILSRTYSLILDLINTQEELVALKKGSKTAGSGADNREEVPDRDRHAEEADQAATGGVQPPQRRACQGHRQHFHQEGLSCTALQWDVVASEPIFVADVFFTFQVKRHESLEIDLTASMSSSAASSVCLTKEGAFDMEVVLSILDVLLGDFTRNGNFSPFGCDT